MGDKPIRTKGKRTRYRYPPKTDIRVHLDENGWLIVTVNEPPRRIDQTGAKTDT